MNCLRSLYLPFKDLPFDKVAELTVQVAADYNNLSSISKDQFSKKLVRYLSSHTFNGKNLRESSIQTFKPAFLQFATKESRRCQTEDVLEIVHVVQKTLSQKIEGLPSELEPVVLVWSKPAPSNDQLSGKDEKQEKREVREVVVKRQDVLKLTDAKMDLSQDLSEAQFIQIASFLRGDESALTSECFDLSVVRFALKVGRDDLLEKCLQQAEHLVKERFLEKVDALLNLLSQEQTLEVHVKKLWQVKLQLLSDEQVCEVLQKQKSCEIFEKAFTEWATQKIKASDQDEATQFFDSCIRPFFKRPFVQQVANAYLQKIGNDHYFTVLNGSIVVTRGVNSEKLSLLKKFKLGALFDSLFIATSVQADGSRLKDDLDLFLQYLFPEEEEGDFLYFPNVVVIGLRKDWHETEAEWKPSQDLIQKVREALTRVVAKRNLQEKIDLSFDVLIARDCPEFQLSSFQMPQAAKDYI